VVFPPYNRNKKIFSRVGTKFHVPVGVEKEKIIYPKEDIQELIKTAAALGFTRIVTQDIVPPPSKKQIYYLLLRIFNIPKLPLLNN